jgi:hypothetical protein
MVSEWGLAFRRLVLAGIVRPIEILQTIHQIVVLLMRLVFSVPVPLL